MLDALARIRPSTWRAIGIVAAVAFCWIAISNDAYVATTPHTIPHHSAVRKLLALGAFVLVGFLMHRSRLPAVRGIASVAIAVGAFSWLIEIGQITIDGSTETLLQHAYDVASGVAGGALGALLSAMSMRLPGSRWERPAVAAMLAIVVVSYPWTYGSWR